MLRRFLIFSSNISQSYKTLTKLKTHFMKEYGLKAAHTMCLLCIGLYKDGITPAELVKYCQEDKAAISRNLASLKEAGLIYAVNDSEGTIYGLQYKLTEQGDKVFQEMCKCVEESVSACTEDMTLEEGATFFKTLDSVVKKIDNYYHNLTKEDNTEQDSK